MATLAAANVVGVLKGWPVWPRADTLDDVLPFLEGDPPHAAPSIVNAAELGLPRASAADDAARSITTWRRGRRRGATA